MSNLRWKSSPSSPSSSCSSGVGVYPILASRYDLPSPGWLMEKQLKLGLDLKGGVHLVLRVKTDDALRLETEQDMERLREELKNAQHHGRATSTRPDAIALPGRRRAAGAGRGVPRRPPTRSRPTSTAAPA